MCRVCVFLFSFCILACTSSSTSGFKNKIDNDVSVVADDNSSKSNQNIVDVSKKLPCFDLKEVRAESDELMKEAKKQEENKVSEEVSLAYVVVKKCANQKILSMKECVLSQQGCL